MEKKTKNKTVTVAPEIRKELTRRMTISNASNYRKPTFKIQVTNTASSKN
jgi:hypothetical protein